MLEYVVLCNARRGGIGQDLISIAALPKAESSGWLVLRMLYPRMQ